MRKEPFIISLLPIIIITLLSVFLLMNWSNGAMFLSPSLGDVPGLFFLGIVFFGLVALVLLSILVAYYLRHN